MDAQTLIALLVAVGVGPAVAALVNGGVAHWSGRAERERTGIRDALERAEKAQRLIDEERELRRAWEAYAWRLAGLASAAGVPIPDPPDRLD